ncbi:MAG: hypothetical protein PHP86_12560 [Nevskiales bacterium]|nr:hypothetical protein [Nevskiales bacterium]
MPRDANNLSAYYGMRSADFGPQANDVETTGSAYGLSQELALESWIKLRLSYDRVDMDPEPGTVADYHNERSSYRIGLVPRIQTGPATIALSFESLRIQSRESESGGWEFFGAGKRSRSGFGIGGSTEFAIGANMTALGEATGYSVEDIEVLEATMRLSYRLDGHGIHGMSLFIQGCDRQFARDDAELRERDLRLGLKFHF